MMNKKGIGKEELLGILIFVLGTVVIVGAIIILWPNLFRLSGTESLRAKVDLAATTKDYTKGLIGTPAENFRCELGQDPREYWTDLSQEVVAQKIVGDLNGLLLFLSAFFSTLDLRTGFGKNIDDG